MQSTKIFNNLFSRELKNLTKRSTEMDRLVDKNNTETCQRSGCTGDRSRLCTSSAASTLSPHNTLKSPPYSTPIQEHDAGPN